MSMSTRVVAFRPADAKWKKMRAIWQSCRDAEIEVPREVEAFFDDKDPDDNGVEIGEKDLVKCGAIKEWEHENGTGFELDVKKLPPDVTVVRFYNSW